MISLQTFEEKIIFSDDKEISLWYHQTGNIRKMIKTIELLNQSSERC